MTSKDVYRDFISDLAAELIQLVKNPDIYALENEFNRGYRAALYSAIHLIEIQADTWEIDRAEIGLGNFDSDDWRQLGKSYFQESA